VTEEELAAERLTALLDAERENTALRATNADLRVMVDGLENAAHEERAAVVAWLRDGWCRYGMGVEAANAIERGEHRRKVEEP
jgi:hypothetical protein